MLRRVTLLAAFLVMTWVATADCALSAAVDLAGTLKTSEYILTAKVELVDADRPAIILTVDEDLKGKFPVRRLLVNMTGDKDAKDLDHRPQILKRLAPKLPVVLFIAQKDDKLLVFAFTDGTWFQMVATTQPDPQKTVFAFTHGEPFLRRTFKGTTEEMRKLVVGGLAGKAKLPKMNPKEPPGFGPEVDQGRQPEKQTRAADLSLTRTSWWFVPDPPQALPCLSVE